MKIFLYQIFLVMGLSCFMPLLSTAQFSLGYGDNNPNTPRVIKSSSTGIYVAGSSSVNTTPFGTIVKLNPSTGAVIWQIQVDFSSQINDMDFVPPAGPLIPEMLYVVGHTMPFSNSSDNASFLLKINTADGSVVCSSRYDQYARESFTRIVRHPNASNPNFPYYILGFHTLLGSTAPFTQDKVVLINLNAGCGSSGSGINVVKEYSFSSNPADDEFYRGIIPLSDGSLVLTGNQTANGFGMAVKVAGNGNPTGQAVQFSRDMEVNDGIELPDGKIALVGEYFTGAGLKSSVIFLANGQLKPFVASGLDVSQINGYNDIYRDNNGHVYTTGLFKNPNGITTFPVVTKFAVGGSALNPTLILNETFGLETSPLRTYTDAVIDMQPFSSLHYAEGRSDANPDLDIKVAKSDNALFFACKDSLTITPKLLEIGSNDLVVNAANYALPVATAVSAKSINLPVHSFCSAAPPACEVSFVFNRNGCGRFSFVAQTNLTGTISYAWNFGTSPSSGSALAAPTHVYTANGTYDVCLTVGNGLTSCQTCIPLVVFDADVSPPVLTCPASQLLETNPGHCYATYLPEVTVVDSCDQAPVCDCVMTGATTGNMPKNTLINFNTGLTTVTCTAKDAVGLVAVPCSFTVTVVDREAPFIGCPADITIDCNGPLDPATTGKAVKSDNCPGETASHNDLISGDLCRQLIERVWKVTDAHGNVSTCTQRITAVDDTAPTITGCGRKVVLKGTKVVGGKCTEWVDLPGPTATDDCSSTINIKNDYTFSGSASFIYEEGETYVSWTVQDACGNEAKCIDTIIVLPCDTMCCEDRQAFIDRVVAQTIWIKNDFLCSATIEVPYLFKCDHLETINWGDGTVQNGPFTFPVSHTYAASGVYQTKCLFIESDENGQGCYEYVLNNEIYVNCPSQCDVFSEISIKNDGICIEGDDITITPVSNLNAPSPRGKQSAIWTGTEMIIWGGNAYYNSPIYLDTGSKYSPSTDTWNPISTINAPLPRDGHSTIWTGIEMIIWGGYDNLGYAVNSGSKYNPSTDTWTPISNLNAPLPRLRHTAVWTGSEMIIWGGDKNDTSTPSIYNTGAKYNPSTDMWTTVSTLNSPSPRTSHTAIWTGDEMIVWGGGTTPFSNAVSTNTGSKYNPTTDTWTPLTTLNSLSPRIGHTAIWTGNEMIIHGGSNNLVALNSGGKYNPLADSWTAIDFSQYSSPYFAAWSCNNMLSLFYGGIIGIYDYLTNTWSYNTKTDWINRTPVFTGTQILEWGGYFNTFAQSTGEIISGFNNPFKDNLNCDGPIKTILCPLPGSPHILTGNASCTGFSPSQIAWFLKDSGGNIIKSGTSAGSQYQIELSDTDITQNGIYTLNLVSYCDRDTCLCEIKMKFEDCITNSRDKALDDSVHIYPNPTSGHITLDFNNGNTAFEKASILDLHGRLIKTIPLPKGITKQEIDLFKYESGMYLLRLMDRNGRSIIKKIVKVD